MNNLEIQSIINSKERRQFVLEARRKNILAIDENISESNLGKNLKGFYYYLKRFILFIIAFFSFISAVIFFISPQIFIDESIKNEIKKEMVNEYLTEIENDNTFMVQQVITEIRQNENFSTSDFRNALDQSMQKLFEKKAEEDFLFFTKFIATILFIFSILLFYISRLTKKLKERNDLILESDKLAQVVIEDYNKTLEEERNELDALKRAYFKSSTSI